MTTERTFLAVKPKAFARGAALPILHMITENLPDMKCLGMKIYKPTREIAEKHYAEHEGKDFFEDLITCFISDNILGMVWEGEDVVKRTRTLIGATDPNDAENNTIRIIFGKAKSDNAIHGSDAPATGESEIAIHFDIDKLEEITNPIEYAKNILNK